MEEAVIYYTSFRIELDPYVADFVRVFNSIYIVWMKRGIWTTSTSRTSTVASTPQVSCVRVNRKRLLDDQVTPVNNLSDIYYRAVVYPSKEPWDMLTSFSDLQEVGRGSYGEVVRADSTERFGFKQVAIKRVEILEDDHASDWENGLRLVREIFFLKNLSHPNLSSLLCLFPNSGHPQLRHIHIVTEYFTAGSLSQYTPKTFAELVSIQSQILSGLAYMHSHNVLHRDVKRENVFVKVVADKGVHVVLGDFGLSRSAVKSGMTAEVVTKPYRCPSLLLGATQYGTEIDVYATGLVLLEMMLGKRANTLLPNRKISLRNFIRHQVALASLGRKPHVSDRLFTLCAQMHLDIDDLMDQLVTEAGFEDKLATEWSRQTWASAKSVYGPPDHVIELAKRMVAFDPRDRCSINEALLVFGGKPPPVIAENEFREIRESFNEDVCLLESDQERADAIKKAIEEMVKQDELLGPYLVYNEPVSRRTRLQRRRQSLN